jgi:c-di-AMP phosphodiesterase-like protein
MAAVLAFFAPRAAAFLAAAACGALFWNAKNRQRRIESFLARRIAELTASMERADFFALSELPIAVAAFDGKGRLRWRNKACESWFPCDQALLDVEHILPGVSLEKFEQGNAETPYAREGKYYRIAYRSEFLDEAETDRLLLFYMTDVTQYENMKEKFDDSRLAVAYLQFDNYNNVLKGLSDSQRENLKAEVNKLAGAWVDEIKGVYRQYSDDMYFIVMHRKSLEEAINKKFDILDRFREIKMGNKLPVTFSLGASCADGEIAAISEKARSCLDMALGRGGDQAAVSFDGNILFFGGMTMAQEKNTRVGARSAAHVIRELMSNADAVFVAGHINEDFDSIGAAIGVAKMALTVKKPVRIINSEQGIALVKFRELAADYEEYKNILISDEEAVRTFVENSLLILVDHNRPVLCAAPGLLRRLKNKVVIDHHRRSEDFISDAALIYQEPAASSTSELVTELITYFADNVEFNRLEASILYAGILVDSKNFAVQTGARTFEAAAVLRTAGADPHMVRQLFREDVALVKCRAKLYGNMEILEGGIAISSGVLPPEGHSSLALAQVADGMLNLEGVNSSFALGQMGEEITVSARSSGRVNVQLIMEELGGGGHQTVAGVKIKKVGIDDLKAQIVELVKKQMEESEAGEGDSAAR